MPSRKQDIEFLQEQLKKLQRLYELSFNKPLPLGFVGSDCAGESRCRADMQPIAEQFAAEGDDPQAVRSGSLRSIRHCQMKNVSAIGVCSASVSWRSINKRPNENIQEKGPISLCWQEKAILQALAKHRKESLHQVTIVEVVKGESRNSVRPHLKTLEDKGLIHRPVGHPAQGIRDHLKGA